MPRGAVLMVCAMQSEVTSTDERRALREAIADYEGARRRAERELARSKEELRASLVADLLPVLDSLDRAIEALAPVAGGLGDSVGMGLVRAQLESVMRGYGLVRFDAIGEPFDPRLHEALDVAAVDDPARRGRVVAQWTAGYRIDDRVLRPARVTVGR